ncbi:hypothetical protein NX794_15845 [Streptomyces sp. LP11]|uniref:Uncharacterized protein n=1 Tax=Streptomyces pyxinicus TaxID=2970331 RepID=A0ABT2B2M1_9ACTN|nr:hypothetical protein [Streptomyces sp. LP11]MCS0602672.1 hypothetical protein [Streptomyces sp. LP11]
MELVPPPRPRLLPDPLDDPTWVSRLVSTHEMPLTGTLNEAQRAGRQCMWCPATAPVELRPLEGMEAGWPPRVCAACVEARTAKVETFILWVRHAAECEACEAGPRCAAAVPLAEAHATACETATGSRLVTCMACQAELSILNPGTVPRHWPGDAGSYFSYLHSPKCRSRSTGGGRLRALPPPHEHHGEGKPNPEGRS